MDRSKVKLARTVLRWACWAGSAIGWIAGLAGGWWAMRALGPAAWPNKLVVFGRAGGPWFEVGGFLLLTAVLIAALPPVDG